MPVMAILNYFEENTSRCCFLPYGEMDAINDITFISCLLVRVLILLT